MSTISGNDAFDRGTDPILKFITAEQAQQILQFHGDELMQCQIEELAKKANEGELTNEELAEYEGYIRANKFWAIIQAKARKLLDQ